uniref:antileukoproteinase-like n=1 Tax=Myxine glutinosa TaxID=7769 RepID=UPI00358E330D
MKLSLAVALIIGISIVELAHGVAPRKVCPPKNDYQCIRYLDQCQSDSDCEHHKICCPGPCGKDCRSPLEKPGLCPPIGLEIGMCADFCSQDFECRDRQKCCSNGCGHDCMNPIYLKG